MNTLPLNTIICGDNVEVMSGWPDGCIDLTVGSPPYDLVDGDMKTHSDKGLRDYDGYEWDFTAVARQLYRVTKQGGVVVWVVNDATVNGSETGSSFRQALYFMGLGFNMETMIYQKDGTSAAGDMTYYLQAHEYMFVFSKGRPKTVNIIRDRKNKYAGKRNSSAQRFGNGKYKDKESFVGKQYGRRFNIWKYNPGQNSGLHPAPFPESLAHDHIISWSNPGDVVLDPFCGSGTTPKMCAKTDRNYIGIDISEEYCQLARRRVAAVKQQPKLFTWDLQPAAQ